VHKAATNRGTTVRSNRTFVAALVVGLTIVTGAAQAAQAREVDASGHATARALDARAVKALGARWNAEAAAYEAHLAKLARHQALERARAIDKRFH
jgi:hypothetical protein